MFGTLRIAALIGASSLLLTACLGEAPGSVTRAPSADQTPKIATTKTQAKINADSSVIQTLVARKSALTPGSSLDEVARAVLAANARTAESELRAARLRAEAASKNWLPRIGPDISLTSLSRVVAALVIDATLFDHGRKKAERAFAKADVEVAAVMLAEDSNTRVLAALTLYLTAQEGREKARLDAATLKQMTQFQYIISERVRGGVSDTSDLNVIRQKLAEIRASQMRNEEAARTALVELNAMAAHPVDGISGTAGITVSATAVRPLAVVRADAERDRTIAQAAMDRAGLLPGITASARVGDESGARVGSEGSVGLGIGAQLKAIEAAREAADRRVAQSTEDSNRVVRRLESEIAAKSRQASEAAGLTRAANTNLILFQQQFDAGQRQVLDVVQVYETFARQQEMELILKYEAALVRFELAHALGVLADGESI